MSMTMDRMLWAGCVSALLVGCRAQADEELLTAMVKRGALIFKGSFYGELEARKKIAIHTPDLSGMMSLTVESVLEDGTEVKKGEVVLRFDKGPIEDVVREEQANLAVAEAEMRRLSQQLDKEQIELRLQLKRREMSVERAQLNVIEGVNLISKLELEKAKLDLEKAKLELNLGQQALTSFAKQRDASLEVQRLKVATIRDKLKEKEAQLNAMEIRAPESGVIFAPYTRLNWVRGKVAPGSVTRSGDKVLEIPDLSAFNAVLFVRQRDATLLKKGDSATIFATVRPDTPIKGTVVEKEDFATTRNERLGTENSAGNLKEIRVKVELENVPAEIRPGGTVRADVSATLAENVQILPLAALVEEKGKYHVQLSDGTLREIKMGRATTTHAEILSGVKEGDRVMLGRMATESKE